MISPELKHFTKRRSSKTSKPAEDQFAEIRSAFHPALADWFFASYPGLRRLEAAKLWQLFSLSCRA